jgi:membrane associated rhomboid family serine protease
VSGGLGRVMAYQRPFRLRVASEGLVTVAPVSVAYALLTLVVSAPSRDPGAGHRLVAACCAWRAPDLPRGDLAPLLGSALLVRRPVEAIWSVVAVWLLLGPLEAMVGGRRLLLLGAVGHVVSTVAVDLCWLAGPRVGGSLAGLDVGTSAVVVTAAAALAVCARSAPLAVALGTGLAVDLATTPNLASVEHLVGAAIGVAGALILRPSRRPRPIPVQPAAAALAVGVRRTSARRTGSEETA